MYFGDTIPRRELASPSFRSSITADTYRNQLQQYPTMLLSKLLLLPVAVASSVTLYVSSVPASASADTAIVASPIPLAQIEYDADQSVGTLASYTPPTGSYSADHLLRVGLTDSVSGPWRGVLTSAASFSDQYHKKFVIHVDEKGEPYHIGFRTRAKSSEEEVEVEIVKKNDGPKPVLNKPIVLNAEGKIDGKEPEKTFLQKCAKMYSFRSGVILTITQVLVGSRTLLGSSASRRWRRREISSGSHMHHGSSLGHDDYQILYHDTLLS